MDHQWLPTIRALEQCLTTTTSTRRIKRRRSYSLGVTNSHMLLTPRPPFEKEMLKSHSETNSGFAKDLSDDELPSNQSSYREAIDPYESYKFQCKNVSPNLCTIMKLKPHIDMNMNISENKNADDDDDDDVTDRIIPDYYINHTGIKTGALTFDFYDTILDSIRNLRTLNRHQKQYLKTISIDKLIQIIHTYDDIFDTYLKWLICDELVQVPSVPTTCGGTDVDPMRDEACLRDNEV